MGHFYLFENDQYPNTPGRGAESGSVRAESAASPSVPLDEGPQPPADEGGAPNGLLRNVLTGQHAHHSDLLAQIGTSVAKCWHSFFVLSNLLQKFIRSSGNGGSFSAVSGPNLSSGYSFCSMF